jgi:hypothetical protein
VLEGSYPIKGCAAVAAKVRAVIIGNMPAVYDGISHSPYVLFLELRFSHLLSSYPAGGLERELVPVLAS